MLYWSIYEDEYLGRGFAKPCQSTLLPSLLVLCQLFHDAISPGHFAFSWLRKLSYFSSMGGFRKNCSVLVWLTQAVETLLIGLLFLSKVCDVVHAGKVGPYELLASANWGSSRVSRAWGLSQELFSVRLTNTSCGNASDWATVLSKVWDVCSGKLLFSYELPRLALAD